METSREPSPTTCRGDDSSLRSDATEGRFRKRPVVIDAFRLGSAWPDWWAEAHAANRAVTFNTDGRWRGGPDYAEIQTLEGVMRANNGDWIIRGVAGEIYPCKPDIFAATYEPADADTTERSDLAREEQ